MIVGKLIELFKIIFRKKQVLPLPESGYKNKIEKRNIKDEIKITIDDRILKLQKEYETGNIKETQLTNKKIKELIKLYQNQINELNYEIAVKKRYNTN